MPSTLSCSVARLTEVIENQSALESFVSSLGQSIALASEITPEQWRLIGGSSHGCIAASRSFEYRRYWSLDRHQPLSYPLPENQAILLEPHERN